MNPRFPRQILIYAALLFLFCGVSQARIGENYDELVARYGKPTTDIPMEGLRKLLFEKEGFFIGADLVDNKAELMSYSYKNKERDRLSEHDVKAFLDKNIGINKKAEWTRGSLIEETQYFRLKYGEGTEARWQMDRGYLTICTRKWRDALKARSANEANQKLKAF
jgi:hypothetical protein